jgi:glutamate carboxypeptidase
MTDGEIERIVDYLQRERPGMVELLRRLALAESPSDDRAAVAGVLDILAPEFGQSGMSVRRLRGRESAGMLYARPRERDRTLPRQLLIGHCDTVWPVGTVSRMPVRVEGDALQGPGVFDMKGGLVQMIFALRALQAFGFRPPAESVVLINSDEEIGSPDSTPLIRRLARRAARAFVLEPAFGRSGKLKTARKASGGFTITVRGRAAHAGINPEEGASAILEMTHQVQRLFALNDAARGINVNVGTIEGGLRSNVVAPEVRFSVDARVRTSSDAAAVAAAIRGLRPVNPRTTIRVEGGIEQSPMEALPRNQALWRLASALGQRLGLELDQAEVGGTSDGNTTSQYTATLDGLGAVGDGAHADHEHVLISRMVERCALLVLLLLAPQTRDGRDAGGPGRSGAMPTTEQP